VLLLAVVSPARTDAVFVGQVLPLALAPDGSRLLAVNTPHDRSCSARSRDNPGKFTQRSRTSG